MDLELHGIILFIPDNHPECRKLIMIVVRVILLTISSVGSTDQEFYLVIEVLGQTAEDIDIFGPAHRHIAIIGLRPAMHLVRISVRVGNTSKLVNGAQVPLRVGSAMVGAIVQILMQLRASQVAVRLRLNMLLRVVLQVFYQVIRWILGFEDLLKVMK